MTTYINKDLSLGEMDVVIDIA